MTLLQRFLVSMAAAVLAIGLISAAFIWLQTYMTAERQLDRQLQQVAVLVVEQNMPHGGEDGVVSLSGPMDLGGEGFVVQVWEDQRLLYASDPHIRLPRLGAGGLRRIQYGGGSWRVISAPAGGRIIQVGQSMEVQEDLATTAAFTALLPLLLALPALGLLAAWMLRKAVAPLDQLSTQIQQRHPLSDVPLKAVGVPREMRPLVEAFNLALQRTQAALSRERAFVADAAHALRTPLGALQLQAEVLAGARNEEARRERLAELQTGIQRVVRLSRQLLDMARGQGLATAANVTLKEIFDTMLGAYRTPLPGSGAKLVFLLEPAAAGVHCATSAGDAEVMVSNLVDNALRHSPRDGRVELAAGVEGALAWIEVRDEGHGLPEDELERVLQRFYRARGDSTQGTGLGLAIVRTLASRAGGSIRLRNRGDRSGIVARLELPRSDEPPTGGSAGTDGMSTRST